MKNRMTLALFAKKLGYKRADAKELHLGLKYLQKIGALKVKQGGFFADSLNHPKIVIVKDWDAVNMHFQLKPEKQMPKIKHSVRIYEFTCGLPETEKCTSRKHFKKQGVVCTFPDTCNQKKKKGALTP